MSKAKWKHKAALAGTKEWDYKPCVCGVITIQKTETYWKNVNCSKCLLKKGIRYA